MLLDCDAYHRMTILTDLTYWPYSLALLTGLTYWPYLLALLSNLQQQGEAVVVEPLGVAQLKHRQRHQVSRAALDGRVDGLALGTATHVRLGRVDACLGLGLGLRLGLGLGLGLELGLGPGLGLGLDVAEWMPWRRR
jgi:hypothetical protein